MNPSVLRAFARRIKSSRFAPIAIAGYRSNLFFKQFARQNAQLARWLFLSRETTNYTYELDDVNRFHLAHLLSSILEKSIQEVLGLFSELETNDILQRSYSTAAENAPLKASCDPYARFARRIAWYAIARVTRPKLIVETGIDKGLGALALTAALSRNLEEGYPGRYIGLDINPNAGALLVAPFCDFGEIRVGDSITTLNTLNSAIDLFVSDSDHTSTYESQEYIAAYSKLSKSAIIIGDNCKETTALCEFSLAHGRRFFYFKEEPKHWHGGAGMGLSLP